MKKAQGAILGSLLILFLAACAPAVAPAPAPAPAAPAPAPTAAAAVAAVAPAKAAWQVEWEKTIEAAKKEGSFVLITGIGAQARRIIETPFMTKYGVRVESVSGRSAELRARVFAEQRAGIYLADMWIGGARTYRDLQGALDSLDSALILPELTEPELIKKTWFFGELSWADKAHTMLISLIDLKAPISTNTNLVKAGEITDYRDLLAPKWKGKISLNDPRIAGAGELWFATVLELGDVDVNYFRELMTKQELLIMRDERLQVDWLARGKHAVALAPHSTIVPEFMAVGAPVNKLSLGTPFTSGGWSGLGLFKRQPHPNAAKLFFNWLLSQEGQTFHAQAVDAQGQRFDVPTTHLEASRVLKPGVKAYRTDNEEFVMKRAKDALYDKLAKELFGP